MTDYCVTLIGELYFYVSAEDEDEAFDKAWDEKNKLSGTFKVRDSRIEEV